MLSKNLENSTSYDIFYKFWKKTRVYYTVSISRGGGGKGARPPAPPGFATELLYNHQALDQGGGLIALPLVIEKNKKINYNKKSISWAPLVVNEL